MTFTVVIDDTQRLLFIRALNLLPVDVRAELAAKPGDAFDTALEDANVLQSMLSDLPGLEEESPGVIHGLCL